jgi:hypothetical protein
MAEGTYRPIIIWSSIQLGEKNSHCLTETEESKTSFQFYRKYRGEFLAIIYDSWGMFNMVESLVLDISSCTKDLAKFTIFQIETNVTNKMKASSAISCLIGQSNSLKFRRLSWSCERCTNALFQGPAFHSNRGLESQNRKSNTKIFSIITTSLSKTKLQATTEMSCVWSIPWKMFNTIMINISKEYLPLFCNRNLLKILNYRYVKFWYYLWKSYRSVLELNKRKIVISAPRFPESTFLTLQSMSEVLVLLQTEFQFQYITI